MPQPRPEEESSEAGPACEAEPRLLQTPQMNKNWLSSSLLASLMFPAMGAADSPLLLPLLSVSLASLASLISLCSGS